jgi:hypothetical protein
MIDTGLTTASVLHATAPVIGKDMDDALFFEKACILVINDLFFYKNTSWL